MSLNPAPSPPLLGLVLCGGESRRMGSDKGLLLKDGIPWALQMGQKLSPWKIPVFYSINGGQQVAYNAILPASQLIVDALGLPGPVNGLFSLHQRMPNPDILLLACDMLDLDKNTIEGLLTAYQVTDHDFLAYGDQQLWQPFCCIYTARGLDKSINRNSLQSLLRTGKTECLQMIDPAAFANYNTL